MTKKLQLKEKKMLECKEMILDYFNKDEMLAMNWFLSKNSKFNNETPFYYIKNDKINYLWKKIKRMIDNETVERLKKAV
jgi:hypothetical protein